MLEQPVVDVVGLGIVVSGDKVAGIVKDQRKSVQIDVAAGKAVPQAVDKLRLLIEQALDVMRGAAGKSEFPGRGEGELQVFRQFKTGILQALHELFSQFGMLVQVGLRLLGILVRAAGGGQLAVLAQGEGQAGDIGKGGGFKRFLKGGVEFLFYLLLVFGDLTEGHAAVPGKPHGVHGILYELDHAGYLAGHGRIGGSQAAQGVLGTAA